MQFLGDFRRRSGGGSAANLLGGLCEVVVHYHICELPKVAESTESVKILLYSFSMTFCPAALTGLRIYLSEAQSLRLDFAGQFSSEFGSACPKRAWCFGIPGNHYERARSQIASYLQP